MSKYLFSLCFFGLFMAFHVFVEETHAITQMWPIIQKCVCGHAEWYLSEDLIKAPFGLVSAHYITAGAEKRSSLFVSYGDEPGILLDHHQLCAFCFSVQSRLYDWDRIQTSVILEQVRSVKDLCLFLFVNPWLQEMKCCWVQTALCCLLSCPFNNTLWQQATVTGAVL